MTRLLAIDLGLKRTGLAVGDSQLRIASPVGVIETAAEEERLRGIARAIQEQGPDALVLGVPYNMDGSAGPAAKQAMAFARRLEERFGLTVHLADERLTSAAADEQMARTGLTHGQKKARRDALAAAAILRAFWDAEAADSQ